MSCDYCKDGKIMFRKEEPVVPFGEVIGYDDLICFVDIRGYIRLALEDDTQCLDHSEKIKINYCPICGDSFKEAKK